MAYTTNDAIIALNNYLGISEADRQVIENTKKRGFVLSLSSGEDVVIYTYPLVHKMDGAKTYFDTRDSGAKERMAAWNYALSRGMKYFCLGVNNDVEKYTDYVFSLECDEKAIEILSGTKDGERSGPGNQVIIPIDFTPSQKFERIQNRLGVYIATVHKSMLKDYLNVFDNRPYLNKFSNDILKNASKPTLPDLISTDKMVDPKVQKERFHNWANEQRKSDGELYIPDTIKTYIRTMETCFTQFKKYKDYDSVFQIQNSEELSEYINSVFDDPGFDDFNKNHSNQSCSRGLQMYQQFLIENSTMMDSKNADKMVDPKEQKERFRNWHEKQRKSDGDYYSPNTVNTRISAMETGFSRFKDNKDYDSVFQIQSSKELSEYINALANDQKFIDYDKRLTNHCSEGLNMYQQFLDENECGSGELCFATLLDNSMPRNQIIFGAPGTGKSYTLNKMREELLGEENETNYERVTFHPDYSYANFVGTYKPVPCKDSDDKDAITYEYVPGPFMRVYVNALENGRTGNPKPFLLIIEEINRADVAAVFGDVFQLLDRNDDGVSEYPIQASEDIRKYLSATLKVNQKECEKIKIPDNMFIWATMNSADQGVFPMDTAFKRRWDFTYLGIDDSEQDLIGKKVELGKDGNRHSVEWNNLRYAINRFLAEKGINEDKQLGPYFISRKIVVPKNGDKINSEKFIDTFKNKVLMYLFEDAAKQKRSSLFAKGSARYSEICKDFEEKGVYVFCDDIVNWAKIVKINESDSPVSREGASAEEND